MTRNKASLQQEIAQINVSLQGKITQNTAALREEIALLDKRVAENNANLIKWMFIFWVGQVGVMIGILFAFLSKRLFRQVI
ncbi:hypothetical protein BMS3Abin05_02299 [bacterium BMS3Abin05]|nr:hypothetical protein BMS3Abin05_02299 [bacterium BMS3Abin05]